MSKLSTTLARPWTAEAMERSRLTQQGYIKSLLLKAKCITAELQGVSEPLFTH